jgi:hypothetical protein
VSTEPKERLTVGHAKAPAGRKTGVLDASSAILLFKADLFDVLLETYAIVIAESVYKELSREGYPGAEAFRLCRASGVVTVAPVGCGQPAGLEEPALLALDRGERDTIRCLDDGWGDFVITDDGRAARHCLSRGIPNLNALLFSKVLSLVEETPNRRGLRGMETLLRIGRYSSEVIDFAVRCTREDVLRFLP